MMKKAFLTLLFISIYTIVVAQKEYYFKSSDIGRIPLKSTKVKLLISSEQSFINDSVIISLKLNYKSGFGNLLRQSNSYFFISLKSNDVESVLYDSLKIDFKTNKTDQTAYLVFKVKIPDFKQGVFTFIGLTDDIVGDDFIYEIFVKKSKEAIRLLSLFDKKNNEIRTNYSSNDTFKIKSNTNKLVEIKKIDLDWINNSWVQSFKNYCSIKKDTIIYLKKGTYSFIQDSTVQYFSVLNKNFPKPSLTSELIHCLCYITSSKEYQLLVNSNNPKLDLDIFWSSISSDNYKARKLIQIYYNRIKESNEQFGLNDKEGWKTTKGMIYVLLGRPDHIKNGEIDKWMYKSPLSMLELELKFNSKLNDYQIVNPNWDTIKKESIDKWKTGTIEN